MRVLTYAVIALCVLALTASAQVLPVTRAVTVNPTNMSLLYPTAEQLGRTNSFLRFIYGDETLSVVRSGTTVRLRSNISIPDGLLTEADAAATYQLIGDYALSSELAGYQPAGSYMPSTQLVTSAMISDNTIGTEDIGASAVGSDEIAPGAVTVDLLSTNFFLLDIAKSGTSARVIGLLGRRLPAVTGHGGHMLGLDSASNWVLVAVGAGDMRGPDYDTNGLVGFWVDRAVLARSTTNATGVLGYPASTGGRVDESVLTYDDDTKTYLHRSLGDLGGGNMGTGVYDIDVNGAVDLADVANTATVSRATTNALGILSRPATTTGRVDESVLTYDDDTKTYLHRSLGDLGGGNMGTDVYDVDGNDIVDLAAYATTASGVVAGAVGSAGIANSSISNIDIAANASISPSKIAGTALTGLSDLSGDVDGTPGSTTVVGLRGAVLSPPAATNDGMAVTYRAVDGRFAYAPLTGSEVFSSDAGTGVVARTGAVQGYFLRDDGTFAAPGVQSSGYASSLPVVIADGQATVWLASNAWWTLDLTGQNRLTNAAPWNIVTNGWDGLGLAAFGLRVATADQTNTFAWPSASKTNAPAPAPSSTNFYFVIWNGSAWESF